MAVFGTANPGSGHAPDSLTPPRRTIRTSPVRGTAGIALFAGRHFDDRDRQGAPPVAIISRELADRLWSGEDPVGKQVVFTTTTRTIVGVVKGVRSSNIQAPPQPELYVPHAQTASRSLTFFIKSTMPASQVLAAARDIVRSIDSRVPLIRPGSFAEVENAVRWPARASISFCSRSSQSWP